MALVMQLAEWTAGLSAWDSYRSSAIQQAGLHDGEGDRVESRYTGVQYWSHFRQSGPALFIGLRTEGVGPSPYQLWPATCVRTARHSSEEQLQMPRRKRDDEPGAWLHVANRAIGRRVLFEDAPDVRFFLSCVAREVRRGTIEVHSFCIMTTHYPPVSG